MFFNDLCPAAGVELLKVHPHRAATTQRAAVVTLSRFCTLTALSSQGDASFIHTELVLASTLD
jgi:hypothetical protein